MSLAKIITMCALSLGLTTVALAAPSFIGPTGLLLIPTADALQNDQFNIGVFSVEDADFEAYTFNYGIRPNFEAGFSRLTDRETIVNLKYSFQPETERSPALAVGAIDLTDQVNTALYVVGSKTLDIGDVPGLTNPRLHIGLAGGGDEDTAVPLNSFFGGVSVNVARIVTLMAEHDGHNMNFGGRVNFARGVEAHVGLVGDDTDFVFGLSYTSSF